MLCSGGVRTQRQPRRLLACNRPRQRDSLHLLSSRTVPTTQETLAADSGTALPDCELLLLAFAVAVIRVNRCLMAHKQDMLSME